MNARVNLTASRTTCVDFVPLLFLGMYDAPVHYVCCLSGLCLVKLKSIKLNALSHVENSIVFQMKIA